MNDFENIVSLLDKHDYLILLGAGGVGKSYNINKIVDKYKEEGKNVEVTSPTGISAINIGGVTINSLLKFADTNSMEEYNVYLNEIYAKSNPDRIKKLQEKMNEKISNIDLLVIDEVSMIGAEKWELIHFLLNKFNFEGKIIMSGDVFQLKPIFRESKYLKDNPIDDRLFFESLVWKSYKFVPYILEKVYRTTNQDFIETLHNIRVGEFEEKDNKYLYNMTKNMKVWHQNPTVLASTNKFVFEYNKMKLDEIVDELCIQEYKVNYNSFDYITKYKNDLTKFINGFLNIDKKLYLKIGALVIFIVNDKDNMFVNGEKGIVRDILENIIIIEKEDGTKLNVDRYSFPYYDYTESGFEKVAVVKQFPIKLGFALTIHKCQSLSMDNIVINFENMFASGQFYVALSRAKNPDNISIIYKKLSPHMFKFELKNYIQVENKLIEFNKKAKIISKKYLNELNL